ncbi:MAG: PAS domain S-box protein [Bacteroidales bacterium]|nr:PAS domain S-box protein [Bacteroidales bacterium]
MGDINKYIIKIRIWIKYIFHDTFLFTKIGVLLGLLFPVASWIIDISFKNLGFSIESIINIHIVNPIHYIIDISPIIIGIIGYFVDKFIEKNTNKYKIIIDQKNEEINKNSQIAKKIGEGDLAFDEKAINKNDVLGNSLLKMRNNLLSTKDKETEQNWIAEGKEKISNILRLHNDINELSYDILVNLINYINVIQGAFYVYNEETKKIVNVASFGYGRKKYINQEFDIGQGLIGQAAYETDTIFRKEIPDYYVTITSGILSDQKPTNILIVPLITDEKLQGIIEFASIKDDISNLTITFIEELSDIIARTIFNINVHKKTEKLLKDAQKMTEELKENEEELRQNAEEMRATHEELEKSNENLEKQILEVENAQNRLHSLLENASEIISIYTEDLKLKYESPSVTKILGYTPEEMVKGKDIERLTSKGEADLKQMFRGLLDNPDEAIAFQYTFMKKDGKKIFIETTGRNLLHDPAISGIILNSQDITERKRAEKEERMKSKMQALSENSPDMIIRLGIDGRFFYANPIVKIFTGVDNNEVIGKNVEDVNFNEQIKLFFKETIQQIKKTEQKLNAEIIFPTNFGDRIMQINSIPETNEEKELETILFVAHDITERKSIELEIKDKNKKITESINYAERIQGSILPDTKYIQDYFPKSFIFYKPRDVVSGDFPWFFTKEDNIYIAAVDCTGHGVPGALLSFVGYFLLNNVVDHDLDASAGKILDDFHYGVRKTLKQDQADANARDGMDIAFCKINLIKKEIQYAGAHRPLYLIRNGELNEYKGNRKAIGGIPHKKKPEKNFQNYVIEIKPNDKIFFFSDGLPDQVGGPDKRKYQAKRIREGIINKPDSSMIQYSNFFANDFKNWKGENKQIDDVLLIGIEF